MPQVCGLGEEALQELGELSSSEVFEVQRASKEKDAFAYSYEAEEEQPAHVTFLPQTVSTGGVSRMGVLEGEKLQCNLILIRELLCLGRSECLEWTT